MDTVHDYDDEVVLAVNRIPQADKQVLMLIGLITHGIDSTKLLCALADHGTLLRANVHKDDLSSREYHILDDMLDEIADFSRKVNTIWENHVIRNGQVGKVN